MIIIWKLLYSTSNFSAWLRPAATKPNIHRLSVPSLSTLYRLWKRLFIFALPLHLFTIFFIRLKIKNSHRTLLPVLFSRISGQVKPNSAHFSHSFRDHFKFIGIRFSFCDVLRRRYVNCKPNKLTASGSEFRRTRHDTRPWPFRDVSKQ